MSESYPPPPPPPPRAVTKFSMKALIIAVVVIIVVIAVPIGIVLLTGNGSTQHPQTTATPTAHTSTPTPKLTPSGASDVSVLSKSDYVDDLGYFTVVGEVKNTLGTNVQNVKIVATFYDSHNTVIGTDYTFTEIDILKPNQKSPFELSSYPDKITPSSYKLSVEYQATQDQPFEGLTILSQTTSTDIVGYYNVNGEVKNSAVSEATNAKVVATYYNSAGTVIGTSFTYTDPDTISAGETSPFEVSSYPLIISPVRYELQVQGQ